MLKTYFNQFIASRFYYPDAAVLRAQNATVMLMDAFGAACGVVTGPHTIVTACHNTAPLGKNHKPGDITICHPAADSILSIDTIERHRSIDVAILRVNETIEAPSALIDYDTPLGQYRGVMKAHFKRFPAKRPVARADLTNIWAQRNITKGLLLLPEMHMPGSTPLKGHANVFSIFHMYTRPGDSGSGLFLDNGRLLTLNCGGDGRYKATGPVIERFRALAAKQNLTL